eukprot:2123368-Amphidinium_carterae.1
MGDYKTTAIPACKSQLGTWCSGITSASHAEGPGSIITREISNLLSLSTALAQIIIGSDTRSPH